MTKRKMSDGNIFLSFNSVKMELVKGLKMMNMCAMCGILDAYFDHIFRWLNACNSMKLPMRTVQWVAHRTMRHNDELCSFTCSGMVVM